MPDARLIDRRKAIELLEQRLEIQRRDTDYFDGVHCGIEYALGIIEDLPTITQPVQMGKWIWYKNHWECSNCRRPRYHELGLDAAFCGQCGAYMRQGVHGKQQ